MVKNTEFTHSTDHMAHLPTSFYCQIESPNSIEERTNVTTLNLAIPVHPYTLCKRTEN